MAVTRISQSSLKEGLEKANNFLAGFAPLGMDYDSLQTVTVGAGGVASVAFSSIPSGYQHLQIRGVAQASTNRLGIAFNNDTTIGNYAIHFMYSDGASALAGSGNGFWSLQATANTGSIFGAIVCDILDYGSATKFKVWRSPGGVDANGSGLAITYSGLWRSTAAITSIRIYGNETGTSGSLAQFSTFALYGLRAP